MFKKEADHILLENLALMKKSTNPKKTRFREIESDTIFGDTEFDGLAMMSQANFDMGGE